MSSAVPRGRHARVEDADAHAPAASGIDSLVTSQHAAVDQIDVPTFVLRWSATTDAASEPERPTRTAARTATGSSRAQRLRHRGLVAVAAAVLALVAAALIFGLTGGHWFVVRTPSMGTTAPVGTLVLTRPTTVADLHVGDVVAFHPSTMPASTYTHRVVAIEGNYITTRGDINGANDPWRTTDRDLIGRTVVTLPGVGFFLRALPLLAGGSLIVWGMTRWWIPVRFRGPARMLGATLLYLVAALTIRPYVGVVQLAAVNDGDRHEVAAVSTGILPIRLVALPGHGTATPVNLRYGEVGTAVFTNPPADGKFALTAQLHLTGWDWAVVVAMWSIPLLWTILVGFKRPESETKWETGIDTGRLAIA